MVGSLVLSVILSMVLLDGPGTQDVARTLRIAWASQYEWKEDKLANVALDFTWSTSWTGARGGGKSVRRGTGHILASDGEVVRRHYPKLTRWRRDRLDRDLQWVLGRFQRRPFEEAFQQAIKEAGITAQGKTSEGALRVRAGGRLLWIAEERIVGEEIDVIDGDATRKVPVQYRLADLGDGYGVVEHRCSYPVKDGRVEWTTTLDLRTDVEFPAPLRYRHVKIDTNGRREVTIDFAPPRVNVEHPVVLDVEARDLLAEAWTTRYTLPDEIRIECEFSRELDNRLEKAGWQSTVKGEIQVWGMDKVTFALDERLFRNRRWMGDLRETCERQIGDYFASLRGVPFDEEFAGCGFERGVESERGIEILVLGHPRYRGFRIDEGRVVGHLGLHADDDGWWTHKLRKTRDGRYLVGRMTRRLDREKFTLEFQFARTKGCHVPRRFMAFVDPGTDRDASPDVYGVVEYELRKTRVSFPRKGS